MPGGGTWIFQNKQRPGAYINFVAVPEPVGNVGSRGIMTCALPMKWGPQGELIELLGTDLLDGKSLAKVGYTAFDGANSLPFRLALAGCHKALIFRADTGGSKATATLAGTGDTIVTATAKYNGTKGNSITVVIVADTPSTGMSTVNILVDGIKKETFECDTDTITDLTTIVSDWAVFTAGASASVIPATTGTPLTTGTDGTVSESTYTTYFNLITTKDWQCLALDSSTDTAPALVIAKIKSMRDDLGKKVQGVVYNSVSGDYEGIIGVKQGFKTAADTVPVNLFPLWVASMTAGAEVNESLTAAVVPDATEITGYVAENLIDETLKEGWFILAYRQDGAVCVEQDINCLHTFTTYKGYAFSKNRVVRVLDQWANDAALIFNRNYAGKISNNALGRNLYKNELINLGNQLQNVQALQNFDGAADITVLAGNSVDSVVVEGYLQPVDSMEKLYMTVNVDA